MADKFLPKAHDLRQFILFANHLTSCPKNTKTCVPEERLAELPDKMIDDAWIKQ